MDIMEKIIDFIVLLIIVIVIVEGCSKASELEPKPSKETIKVETKVDKTMKKSYVYITNYTDPETGVCYFITYNELGNITSMTVRYNNDGYPMKDREWRGN